MRATNALRLRTVWASGQVDCPARISPRALKRLRCAIDHACRGRPSNKGQSSRLANDARRTKLSVSSRSKTKLGPRSSRSSVFTVLGLHGPRPIGVGLGPGTGLGTGIRTGLGTGRATASTCAITLARSPHTPSIPRISSLLPAPRSSPQYPYPRSPVAMSPRAPRMPDTGLLRPFPGPDLPQHPQAVPKRPMHSEA